METRYTADDLIKAAAKAGYPGLNPRVITDWVQKGLLDQPVRGKGKGRGAGTEKATFPEAQRDLLLTLVDKRGPGRSIRDLYPIPVAVWLYWGSEFVPTRQARRALTSWAGKHETASAARAKQSVDALLAQLSHAEASTTARKELRQRLTDAANSRNMPPDLPNKIRAVADPKGVGRLIGPPSLMTSPENVVHNWRAARFAVAELRKGNVEEAQLEQARTMHITALAEYRFLQPALASLDASDPLATIKATEIRTRDLIENSARDILLPLSLVLRRDTQ